MSSGEIARAVGRRRSMMIVVVVWWGGLNRRRQERAKERKMRQCDSKGLGKRSATAHVVRHEESLDDSEGAR